MAADNPKAFTLIEVLITLAIILMLIAVFIGGGGYLTVRAERQLTQSAIEVIVTALEQYYEQTDPKQFPPQVSVPGDLETVLSANSVIVSSGSPDGYFWRSATAYYFLSRIPQSKAIVESLTERMISNKDSAGIGVQVQIQMIAGGPTETYDWVRFVDAWGTSLNYEYNMSGYSFPVITSAGPDKVFGTSDDLRSQ